MIIFKLGQPEYSTKLSIKTTISKELNKELLSLRITRTYDNASLAVGMSKEQAKELGIL